MNPGAGSGRMWECVSYEVTLAEAILTVVSRGLGMSLWGFQGSLEEGRGNGKGGRRKSGRMASYLYPASYTYIQQQEGRATAKESACLQLQQKLFHCAKRRLSFLPSKRNSAAELCCIQQPSTHRAQPLPPLLSKCQSKWRVDGGSFRPKWKMAMRTNERAGRLVPIHVNRALVTFGQPRVWRGTKGSEGID